MYVYDAVYPYVKGGAEKRIWELSTRLASRGHEVHVLGIKYWNSNDVFVKDSVYLHGVCDRQELYVDGKRSVKEAIYFSYKVLPHLLNENSDVIDCSAFPYFPCFSAKLCSAVRRSLLIITWHEVWGDYWLEYLGRKGIIGKIIERVTAMLADKMIAVSQRTRFALERVGLRKRLEVIPNGIDFAKIVGTKASEKKSDVIFAGRLVKEKNVDVLIRAVNLIKKEIPYVNCEIIGDGPERNYCMKLIKDLNLENNIELMGFLENHDALIAHMKASKVFVLPSTREGFSIVTLEANACGLPVVTARHERNAAQDLIIDGENGFLCNLSEKEIAHRILTALEENNLIKEKCVEASRKYDWNEIVNLTESFYNY